MNKHDLSTVIMEAGDLSRTKSDIILDAVVQGITDSLVKGDKVTITGFGTFSTKVNAARMGRNPATGEALSIPEKTVAKFKVGSVLAQTVKDSAK